MTAEDKIRRKLAARDALETRLRKEDREIIELGKAWWAEQGCLMFPRIDDLRRVIGHADLLRREEVARMGGHD